MLLVFKLIALLKNKFPSFGVLFDTLRGSKADLMRFCLITIILLFAFAFAGHMAFGAYSEHFSSMKFTFLRLLDFMLGNIQYDKITDISRFFGMVFVLIFTTMFYFILMNFFLAIIMATYMDLRKKSQRLVEAKADMIREHTLEHNQMIKDLIFMRMSERRPQDTAIEILKLQS